MSRAEPGAARTAERLTALGHTPVVAPVLAVRPIPGAAADLAARLEGVSALVFTSRNGVAAFSALTPDRRGAPDRRDLPVLHDLPVFAVGDATADAVRQAGFRDVVSAAGDVTRLAQVIGAAGLAPGGVLLHPGADRLAGDLGGALEGLALRVWPIYASVETGVATPPDCAAVLVHSPRAARILASRRNRGGPFPAMIVALSPAAAAPFAPDDAACVHIAERPDEASLLDCLQAALGKRRPPV